jgi:hypothetical protein
VNPDIGYASLLSTLGSLTQLVAIAMLLERGLSFVFEYHWFKRVSDKVEGIKGPIALGVALLICFTYRFDILAELFEPAGGSGVATAIGIIITATIIAGGSAGAISLFQGVLNWSKESRDARVRAKQLTAAAESREAEARDVAAQAALAEAQAKRLAATAALQEETVKVNDPALADLRSAADRRASDLVSMYDRRKTPAGVVVPVTDGA